MSTTREEYNAIHALRLAIRARLTNAGDLEVSQILKKILEVHDREIEVWEIDDMTQKVKEGLPWSELF